MDTAAELAAPPDVVAMSGVEFTWPGRNPFGLSIANFSLSGAERMLLTGPSGSGKSTLLSLLCGIVAPHSGSINILGSDIAKLPAAARDTFRAEHFGIIFQMFNLLPYASIVDNVLLPLSFAPHRRKRASAGTSAEREAVRLLEKLGLKAQLTRGVRASDLSVGQQQRVAAARALIGAPELIVADEPTSALDAENQEAFLDLLFAELAEAGSTLIMVSHNVGLAPRFDRVLRFEAIAVARQGGAA
jgi:putative ABC transport system ATP-binding protein